LITEPFNCQYLTYQVIAYDALNNPIEAGKSISKVRCIMDALISTGDGFSEGTAIYVISIGNEYDYLFLRNLSVRMQEATYEGHDILYLKSNKYGLSELWFDISQPRKHLSQSFNH
jgi:hypothetical protein